jgi:hypothetical protein
MTLIGGPVSIVLERVHNDKWNVIAEGKSVAAKPEIANSMLDQLHELRGTRIVEDPMTDPQPFGMVHPTLTAVLYDRSGKEIGSIYLSQIEATTRPDAPTAKPASRTFGYASSTADKAVYEITPAQVVDLENTASTLKGESESKPTLPPASANSPTPPIARPSMTASPAR